MLPARITVAVPVHNGADQLERCLRCLRAQTHQNFRAVIFENASTDDSLAIAQRFADTDCRFSIRPSNHLLPPEENFRRAIEDAAKSSPYFLLRAHDDYTDADFLARLLARLTAHPAKALAVPSVVHLDGPASRPARIEAQVTEPRAYLRATGGRAILFPGSWYYGLYRSDLALPLLRRAMQRFPGPWAADRYAVMQFLLRGLVTYEPAAIFYCQLGSGSETKYMERAPLARFRARFRYFRDMLELSAASGIAGPRERLAYLRAAWRTARRHTHYRLAPKEKG